MSFAAVCGTGHAPDGEFEKLDAAWGMDVVWPMIECCDEEGGCGRVFNKFECSLQAAILKNPEIGALRVYTRPGRLGTCSLSYDATYKEPRHCAFLPHRLCTDRVIVPHLLTS